MDNEKIIIKTIVGLCMVAGGYIMYVSSFTIVSVESRCFIVPFEYMVIKDYFMHYMSYIVGIMGGVILSIMLCIKCKNGS